jgi:hypothetical protein
MAAVPSKFSLMFTFGKVISIIVGLGALHWTKSYFWNSPKYFPIMKLNHITTHLN